MPPATCSASSTPTTSYLDGYAGLVERILRSRADLVTGDMARLEDGVVSRCRG